MDAAVSDCHGFYTFANNSTDTQAFHIHRSNIIKKLKETKNPDPYPHKFHVTQAIPRFVEEYGVEGKIESGTALTDAKPVSGSRPVAIKRRI